MQWLGKNHLLGLNDVVIFFIVLQRAAVNALDLIFKRFISDFQSINQSGVETDRFRFWIANGIAHGDGRFFQTHNLVEFLAALGHCFMNGILDATTKPPRNQGNHHDDQHTRDQYSALLGDGDDFRKVNVLQRGKIKFGCVHGSVGSVDFFSASSVLAESSRSSTVNTIVPL